MEALKSVNVVHSYGRGKLRKRVLDSLSIEIPQGSFEALMGRSGSGKSTFLHLAAGLLTPDSGTITVGGDEVSAMSDSQAARFRRRRTGVVFQDFNLLESLSVAENIVLPAKLDGRRPDRARLNALLDALEISPLRNKRPAQISGGERQRAAVARALYAKPDVILADEPTGNLDSASAASLCRLLAALNKSEGCAILLVTHDPVTAAAADRVNILSGGRIAASAPTLHDPDAVSRFYLEHSK